MNQSQKLAVGAGLAGILGWAGYKYWYLPKKAQDALANEMAWRVQQGQDPRSAAEGVFQAICQTGGGLLSAKYGIPPQYAMQMCQGMSAEGLLEFASMSTTGAGRVMGEAIGAVTGNVKQAIGGVESIITTGSEAVWNLGVGLPTKYAERAVNTVVDRVSKTTSNIGKGLKSLKFW